jgi:SanA protein
VVAANAYVLLSARGDSASNVDGVAHAQTAIVLGALVNPNGQMSAMLDDRVRQAALLWRSGKVDRLLVSGDHHKWSYDEPDTMRKALIRAGVPARAIFTDHAGFDTWATMVRARQVFAVSSATVITQGFHMPRALYLAQAAGLHAQGLTSDLHGYGTQGKRSRLREVVARVKATSQGVLHTGVLLGPSLPITGNGRSSWGPPPPPGTPPAGAPN